ncbi:MAG: DNA-processing protein DprA [Lachnospiraceae bacterium]|nr:DNA-processing protein DprA [Lachnospiraceae bacterium]
MKYKLWFASDIVLSNLEKRKLFEQFQNYEEIYRLDEAFLRSLEIIREDKISRFIEERSAFSFEKALEYVSKKNIKVVCYFDEFYPVKLRHIHDSPFQLFYIGNLPDKEERIISMVGARRCSGYGKTMTLDFAKELGKKGFSILSGMASGIDSYAHEGALFARANTFAIFGCGVDICYPPKNYSLYEEIIKNGGVISEYAPMVEPRPEFFPRRNRIISGLADVVLLMEAKEKSGSLITANFALDQGKDIFALPGRISDSLSYGTNKIIEQGAGIITSIEQLISDINELKDWSYDPIVFSSRGKFHLEKEELLVYSCFDFNSKTIDEVIAETGLDIMSVLQIILHLCDLGLIEESFMNQYIKV